MNPAKAPTVTGVAVNAVPVMVNELGPATVLIQTLPKAVRAVADKVGDTAPDGVTKAQVVPTLNSSNSIKGVLVGLSCLKKVLATLAKSVPATDVASAAGSLPPMAAVFNQILDTSSPTPPLKS